MEKGTSELLQTDYRYERKFLVSDPDLSQHEMEMIIKLHPSFFYKLYPFRFVNNLYFDTQDYKNFHDNIEGLSHRQKFRIRWYGDFFGLISKPTLEIKIKESTIGTKKSYLLRSFTIDSKFNWEYLNDKIQCSKIPNNIKEIMKSIKPVIFNRYRRKYYSSLDKKFRITLDNQLAFYLAERSFDFNSIPQKRANSIILELKYNKQYDKNVSEISSYFPFRMTKSSKYVSGVYKFYNTGP